MRMRRIALDRQDEVPAETHISENLRKKTWAIGGKMLHDKDRSVDTTGQVRDNRAERLDAAGGRANDYDIVADHQLFIKDSLHLVKARKPNLARAAGRTLPMMTPETEGELPSGENSSRA